MKEIESIQSASFKKFLQDNGIDNIDETINDLGDAIAVGDCGKNDYLNCGDHDCHVYLNDNGDYQLCAVDGHACRFIVED